MLSGITGAFHALPKAWFWGEKSLGSIKNSNRLLRKSVRTRQNRRRLSDSDFHCVFDAKRCGKPWKHGIFGGLSSAVIFRQIPPSSVLLTWLEMQLSARARGFESHRFRHQSLENSMFSRLFLLLGQHLFWEKQFKWCPWCPALWCPAHSTSYTLYKKDVYCGAPMVPGTAKKLWKAARSYKKILPL